MPRHYTPPMVKATSIQEMLKMPLAHLHRLHELTSNQLNVAVRLTRDRQAAIVLKHRKLTLQWAMNNHPSLSTNAVRTAANS